MVCRRGEQVAPKQWILARVKEVHPGPDEMVRVVTVQTTKGTYSRPIVKVVPLITSEEPL